MTVGSGNLGLQVNCPLRNSQNGYRRVSRISLQNYTGPDVSNVLGDRVQWFRAEAEMQRWLEEWELLQAEFLRCIRAFKKSHEIWKELAASNSEPGYAAYAMKTATMFAKMEVTARNTFITSGYGHLLLKVKDDDWILADHIAEERARITAFLGRPVI